MSILAGAAAIQEIRFGGPAGAAGFAAIGRLDQLDDGGQSSAPAARNVMAGMLIPASS